MVCVSNLVNMEVVSRDDQEYKENLFEGFDDEEKVL